MGERRGYDEGFLGVEVPLPTFQEDLDEHVLRDPAFHMEVWTPYANYSVATNRTKRQPICAALNIDQTCFWQTERSEWSVDDRIGSSYQLDNDYYMRNSWDRGHLARRASASWGDSEEQAQFASDDTMYYSNAALQHENLNQDEWLELEDWVKDLESDSTNRISTFNGPIYGAAGAAVRFVTPSGREPAEIPAAFYKVIAFIDKTNSLAVRAFIVAQDRKALEDKVASGMADLRNYQVSLAAVEKATGLLFPDVLKEASPLGTIDTPEVLPVRNEGDVINSTTSSVDYGVFIAAALVNVIGDDAEGEWVSISNYSPEPVDFTGWTLSDTIRTPLQLSGELEPGEAMRIRPLNGEGRVMLSNIGGRLVLRDASGRVMDRVSFSSGKNDLSPGKPVIFHLKA